MANSGEVSVLICTYNAERFVRSCLDSVLAQSFQDFSIFIADNNSQDGTRKILKEYQHSDDRIECHSLTKNLGAFGGLNFLLGKTKSKYVAILDHDDIWHPEKLRLQVETLKNSSPNIIGCGGAAFKYLEKTRQGCIVTNPSDTFCFHPSLMFVNKNQRYDTTVKYKTDMHFMQSILCADGRKLKNENDVLYLSRVRADGMNLNDLWLTPRNALSYLQSKRDVKSLMALILSILPDRIKKHVLSPDERTLKPVSDYFHETWLKPLFDILEKSG